MTRSIPIPIPIGAVAAATGVKIPTIRYYEQIGLLPQAPRTDSNRRLYCEDDVRRLGFIRHARELGFEIAAIRTLLALHGAPDQPCATADAIARARLAEVEARIAALTSLKSELERMLAGAAHGTIADCRVIETLGNHGQCRHHGA
jgi:DNA-binding transcriptional MerR regulator